MAEGCARRSTRRGSNRPRFPMPDAMRRPARKLRRLPRPQAARARLGGGARAPGRGARRADGGARLCRRPRLRRRPRPPRWAGAAMARGGSARRCARRESARRTAPRRARRREDGRLGRRPALRRARRIGPVRRRARPTGRPAKRPSRRCSAPAIRPPGAAHRLAARPGEIPDADTDEQHMVHKSRIVVVLPPDLGGSGVNDVASASAGRGGACLDRQERARTRPEPVHPTARWRARSCRAGRRGAASSVTGTVKWFDATRGFGFIVSEEAEGDILIHFSRAQGA